MRKIIRTQDEINSQKKKRNVIIGVAIIVIMIFGSAGYAFINGGDSTTFQKYNEFKFYQGNNGLWTLTLNNQVFYFKYLPQEVENISIKGIYNTQTYSGKPLYFVNNNFASAEILNNLGKTISRYQDACLAGMNCTGLPQKTCTDNLIILDLNETDTKVHQDKNCVYISGDFVKGADAFLYKTLNIIK